MKIIDKTPLLDEKGELGISQRIQGMLQYGFSWPKDLRSQQAIITYFDRQLEKGYTLIRNYTLGQSGIMVPMILLGPAGMYVMNITYLRGRYEVQGDQWNVEAGEAYKPAPENLVQNTLRMARAVRKWIERQGTRVPVEIEPVLIAADPGMHIESTRPAVRVLRLDGIKSFVSGLVTGQPVLSTEHIYELTERIVNPRPPRKNGPVPVPAPVAEPRPSWEEDPQEVSRGRAIFDAAQDVKPFNPSDFDFAMNDQEESFEITPPGSVVESSPAQPLPPAAPKPRSKQMLGMTPVQLAIIAGLVLALLCIGAVFAYLVLS